jgi:hypothetical protein
MPAGSETNLLWRNIGLLDGELRPKPAWEIWKAGVAKAKAAVGAVSKPGRGPAERKERWEGN